MGSLALLRGISNIVARLSWGQGWGGRPTERWQDKSREVRGGRLDDDSAKIEHLARCAPSCDSLFTLTSPWRCTCDDTSRMSGQ
jgi:hypothetical protein